MGKLLPSECPNCGHMHPGYDFDSDPGPVQKRNAELMQTCMMLNSKLAIAEGTIRVLTEDLELAPPDSDPTLGEHGDV